MFIDEECEILIVVNDDGGFTRNINQKKEVGRFTIAYRCPLSKKCCRRVYFFNNHVGYCKTGKYDFSCASQVNNLKDWKFFSHQMRRNRFDPVLTKRDWNFPTI